jgi:hypothetical protein
MALAYNRYFFFLDDTVSVLSRDLKSKRKKCG